MLLNPGRIFKCTEKGTTITYQEILDALDEADYPTTKDELRDLLWCYGIDESEINKAIKDCDE